MRLRWLLLPLALLFVGGALWIQLHGRSVSPEILLASARAHLARTPPDRIAAGRELDEALVLAAAAAQDDLRAELLEERARLRTLEGFRELALEDCRARLELGPDADTLARASELALWLGEPGLALEFGEVLVPLDAPRGHARVGRARVAMADSPLAAIEALARNSLPPSQSAVATSLAQRAAVFADDEQKSSAAMEELLELFTRMDERRRLGEWVREAAEHLRAARQSFLASLSPATTSEAVAGLQDLLLRAGSEREAADLGVLALGLPELADPMPVLARTAAAQMELGRVEQARALVLEVKRKKPQALRAQALPSLTLRDELQEWCLLLEPLELWDELRNAAWELYKRGAANKVKSQLALFLAATADLRQNQLANAQLSLDRLGTNPVSEHDLNVRAFLARAEIGRRQALRTQERYALLLATKAAALDPPLPLREEVGQAWQRLFELQQQDGDVAAAEISLTHALRCSSARAAELEPLWHELGRKSLASRGVSSPYTLYARAKSHDEHRRSAEALNDARALLEQYPGLGPALEIVSRAAERLRDFPLMISASLELLERGWPGNAPSGRLRSVPREYFLPQDRVRWLRLDPRGSLEAVVQNLLAKGDVQGAALAARGGPAQFQPPELLPLLARVELMAGETTVANETLALLPAESPVLRGAAGLVLRAALASERTEDLESALTRVLASGEALDPELCAAADVLLGAGHVEHARALMAWLGPQTPSFLGEALLRQTAARAADGTAPQVDDDLERAAPLVADGRPEFGRLVIALERGDEAALAREAQSVLATAFAEGPVERAALLALAGEPALARAELTALVPTLVLDGRDALAELVAGCLPALGAEPLEDVTPLSDFVLEALGARGALVLGLASTSAPWSSWALVRCARLPEPSATDPWVRVLRARSWLSLGEPGRARAELDPAAQTDARQAWLHVEVERALGTAPASVRTAELAWLAARGETPTEGTPAASSSSLVPLLAERALRAGEREEARRLLESAVAERPGDLERLEDLARLEDTEGRRTRALELYGQLIQKLPAKAASARVLELLDVLRRAREEGEISEARWWAEVEALESERPLDPAPARELAERSFESSGPGAEFGRKHALERLARLRQRTLSRPLESLRQGEAPRWIELLARYTPERAVSFAEEELLRAPSDPALWRSSARALIAAGRVGPALERLDALQRVAPELETARLVAVTAFQYDNDRQKFAKRLAGIEHFDPQARIDPQLAFYGGLVSAVGKREKEMLRASLALWEARAENGLAATEPGRALALALFQADLRAEALQVLAETHALADSELARDVIATLSYLMRIAPEIPRLAPKSPAAGPAPGAATREDEGETPDDSPEDAATSAEATKKPGGGKGQGKRKGGEPKVQPGDGAAKGAAKGAPKPGPKAKKPQ